ncbi:hypothetical protein AB3X91_13420 [Paraburkholderia sp. BR14263]|uniref:hypothetical protein n=1 Tax=unclassified Paraburkholderia TaxID=2615204 RepID=UPI0034CFFC57
MMVTDDSLTAHPFLALLEPSTPRSVVWHFRAELRFPARTLHTLLAQIEGGYAKA